MKRSLCSSLASVFLLILLFTGCGNGNIPVGDFPAESVSVPTPSTCISEEIAPTTAPEDTAPVTEPVPTETRSYAQSMIEDMTLREKAGQLFVVTPEAIGLDSLATPDPDVLKQALETYPVGGLILFSRNIFSPEQVTDFNASMQLASKIPLFVAIDEEGGSVVRLASFSHFQLPKYESAEAIGSSGNLDAAKEMGISIGGYLHAYGFNLDFAPVADVNTNPGNPVIGNRAFSSDPEVAASMARAFSDGLVKQDVIATFKHFPGHGDTAEDSHHGLAVTEKSQDEMANCEWLPFREASGSDCIMVGHIAAPNITGNLCPASLSPMLITDILKNQLNFSGLVITDSLSMGAITDAYSSGEAALAAFTAGCHILLMPENLDEAISGIVSAVENGTLSQEQLDLVVEEILQFKLEHKILVP